MWAIISCKEIIQFWWKYRDHRFICNTITQVATLLGYEEPQILKVFKNTIPTKLYWILFPIEDLRQAVETAKRILTKEKINTWWDRLLLAHLWISEMKQRKISFNARDELGDKLDKLTAMMRKLAAKG